MQPMLDDARAACAALPPDDDGIEACTARLALGMALVFGGAGDEGPRDAARRDRDGRDTRGCSTARR